MNGLKNEARMLYMWKSAVVLVVQVHVSRPHHYSQYWPQKYYQGNWQQQVTKTTKEPEPIFIEMLYMLFFKYLFLSQELYFVIYGNITYMILLYFDISAFITDSPSTTGII